MRGIYEKKNNRDYFLATILFLTGCKKSEDKLLDPGKPITVTVWHYYNGNQQATFDKLLEKFNSTVGKEQGINGIQFISREQVIEGLENLLSL